VVIRRSATAEIQQLIADLSDEGPDAGVRREAAIARLRVLGARAVGRLLPLLGPGHPGAIRVAALRALEGCTENRVVEPVLAALTDPVDEVRVAALGVARALLDRAEGSAVLDRITGLALDAAQPPAVRQAAVAAFVELPERTVRPVLARLQGEANDAVREVLEQRRVDPRLDAARAIEEAAAGVLPADPLSLATSLAECGAAAPLPTLHRLIGVVRSQEAAETRPAGRRDWLAVRGTLHLLLATRGSRVALYDLREAFERAAAPLPDDFVRAAATAGDASCLESVAAAFSRASTEPAHDGALWRGALAAAARAIVDRERLTRRHAAIRRLLARWGPEGEELLGIRRPSTPSRTGLV
jgi:hypothetical protein